MDVKEAVTVAKHYVSDLFSDEGVRYVGLEEVESTIGKVSGTSRSVFPAHGTSRAMHWQP